MAKDLKPTPVDLNEYAVVSPLQHDGGQYAPGNTVLLDADTAKVLLGLGVIAEAPSPTPSGEGDPNEDATGTAPAA